MGGFLGILQAFAGNVLAAKQRRHQEEQQQDMATAAVLAPIAEDPYNPNSKQAGLLLGQLGSKHGKEGKQFQQELTNFLNQRELFQQRQAPPIPPSQLLAGMAGAGAPSASQAASSVSVVDPTTGIARPPTPPGVANPPLASASLPPPPASWVGAAGIQPSVQQRPGLLRSLAGGAGGVARGIVEGLTGQPVGGFRPLPPLLQQQAGFALAQQRRNEALALGLTPDQAAEYSLTGRIATPRPALDRQTPTIFTAPDGSLHRGTFDPVTARYLDEFGKPAPSDWIPGREGAAGAQELFKGNLSQQDAAANRVLAAPPGTYSDDTIQTARDIKERYIATGRGQWKQFYEMALTNVGLDGKPIIPGKTKLTSEEAATAASQMLAATKGIQIDLQRQRLWESQEVAGPAPGTTDLTAQPPGALPTTGPDVTPTAAQDAAQTALGVPTPAEVAQRLPQQRRAAPAEAQLAPKLSEREKVQIGAWAAAGGKMTGSLPVRAGQQQAVEALSRATGEDVATLQTDAQQYTSDRKTLDTQIQFFAGTNRLVNTIDTFGDIFLEKARRINQNRAPILNEVVNNMKNTFIGDPQLDQYRLAINALQRQYSTLTVQGQNSRAQLPVAVLADVDNLIAGRMRFREAIALVAQIRREAAGESQAFYKTQQDIRGRILANPISQALGAKLPKALPESQDSKNKRAVDDEVQQYLKSIGR